MTTITKTEKTYSISWDGLVDWDFELREWVGDQHDQEFTQTKDVKEALETFEEIIKTDKNCGTVILHEWMTVYLWDSEDSEWVMDEGSSRGIKKAKVWGDGDFDLLPILPW